MGGLRSVSLTWFGKYLCGRSGPCLCGRFWPRLGMWLGKADFGTGRVARFGTHWQRLRGLLRQVLAVFVWLDLAGCGSLCVCVCVCVRG